MSTTSTALPAIQLNVNYGDIRSTIKDFLTHFKTDVSENEIDMLDEYDQEKGGPKYMMLLQDIANREKTTLYIELDDLKAYQESQYFESGTQNVTPNALINLVTKNTYHYLELFSSVIDELMPEPTKDISYKDDVLDVIIHQRKLRNIRIQQENNEEFSNLRKALLIPQTPKIPHRLRNRLVKICFLQSLRVVIICTSSHFLTSVEAQVSQWLSEMSREYTLES